MSIALRAVVASVILIACSLWMISAIAGTPRQAKDTSVVLIRVPSHGIQPQVAVDQAGVVHMIYFAGEAPKGDIFYVRSSDSGKSFSEPLRVNSQPKSAIAIGNIRGAQMALGRNGRVHVAWMGSQVAEPKAAGQRAPMLFSRLNEHGNQFEPQRNVIVQRAGLDGGGSVAADRDGNVYVAWHAPGPGDQEEGNRRVWISASHDDGKTFAREVLAHEDQTGACACCGIKTFADSQGRLYVLYRTATNETHRDMRLITSRDQGATFRSQPVDSWEIGYCVMSSAAFCETPETVMVAWETEEQVFFSQLAKADADLTMKPIAASNKSAKQKYPSLATNRRGETLVAWTEGVEWGKGAALAWQVFDRLGKPVAGQKGTVDGVPPWSFVTAFATRDGQFCLAY